MCLKRVNLSIRGEAIKPSLSLWGPGPLSVVYTKYIKNKFDVKLDAPFCALIPEGHFTNDFSIAILIRWKFHFVLIWILLNLSQPKLYMQNYVAIRLPGTKLQQIQIGIEFILGWKTCLWSWAGTWWPLWKRLRPLIVASSLTTLTPLMICFFYSVPN